MIGCTGISEKAQDQHDLTWLTLHITFMSLAWGLFLPLGSLLPLLKQQCPVTWFRWHIMCQLTGSILSMIGFWIGLARVALSEETQASRNPLAHIAIGSVMTILLVIQLVIGVLRPKEHDRIRPWWLVLHRCLAYAVLSLAVVQIMIGIEMATDNIKLAVCVPLMLSVTYGVLTFILFRRRRETIDETDVTNVVARVMNPVPMTIVISPAEVGHSTSSHSDPPERPSQDDGLEQKSLLSPSFDE